VELAKRVGAPYFLVTFTVPEQLRTLFFGPQAKDIYDVFFASASAALADTLARPRWLGARTCGFTALLHTWNQRLGFHPHIHCIVPGAGITASGRVIALKDPNFLVPVKVLSRAFTIAFASHLAARTTQLAIAAPDPAVWGKQWGVHIQPFGDGANAVRYLGRYVNRTAISDSRVIAVDHDTVSFRWKDRACGNAPRTDTLTGIEFTTRYMRHVLPRGMRAVRRYGFCHPAAKAKRERIALHTGRPIFIGPCGPSVASPRSPWKCPDCGCQLHKIGRLPPVWMLARPPPVPP
jgi:hypothetical protein